MHSFLVIFYQLYVCYIMKMHIFTCQKIDDPLGTQKTKNKLISKKNSEKDLRLMPGNVSMRIQLANHTQPILSNVIVKIFATGGRNSIFER